jgi:hypothetical protein
MASELQVFRELIRLENETLNYRMSWFLTLHGFLFAAMAFAWDKDVALIVVFAVVGILSSTSVGILLRLGTLAIRQLEERARSIGDEQVIGRGHRETSALMHFLLPWHFLPILFAAAWAALIVIRVWTLT